MASVNWLLGFASIFTLAGLACVAISFSTDYWVVTTVDRDEAEDNGASAAQMASPLGFTRQRGLFRTCYDGNDTVFLDDVDKDDKIDGNCLIEKGYELNRRSKTNDYPSEYDTRIHLMRSHFAMFIMAMLFLVIGVILGVVGCWQIKVSVLQIAGLIVFVGAFFAAGGMAMFHGYDYLEREKLDNDEIAAETEDFPAFWDENAAYKDLAEASKREYGWSYMLGWISVGMSAIGAILFLCASFSYRPPRKQRSEKQMPYAYGNEGYDMGGYPTYPAAASVYGGYGY